MDMSFEAVGASLAEAKTINAFHFGARYASYRNFDRFESQISETDIGMLIWPDGALSEYEDDRYGFDHHGLYNTTDTGQPGLGDIFQAAHELDLGVSVILPTTRYQDDPQALAADAEAFFHDLYGGDFGPLPKKLIFEIGNEFYWSFSGDDTVGMAQDYGAIANVYADIVQDMEQIYDLDPDQVEVSLQVARDTPANEALIETLSDTTLQVTDLLSTHSFNVDTANAGHQIDEIQDVQALWSNAIDGMGLSDPGIYLSAYNAASLTAKEAAKAFVTSDANTQGLSFEDIDLTGRSTQAFEEYYQAELGARAVGMEHGDALLQIFSEYQAVGVEAAGVYGWDMIHPSRSSFRGTDGQDYHFIGGEIQDMMAESLQDTSALDWYQDNDHSQKEDVSVYGFNSPEKLVVFLAAPEFQGDDYRLSFDTSHLGSVEKVWGHSLTGDVPDDWKSLFNVTTASGVDQSAEASTYTVGVRQDFQPEVQDGVLELTFTEPGEIIRLSFARNDAGAQDIDNWHGGSAVDLVNPERDVYLEPTPVATPASAPDVSREPQEEPASNPLVGPAIVNVGPFEETDEDAEGDDIDNDEDEWSGFAEALLAPFSFFGF